MAVNPGAIVEAPPVAGTSTMPAPSIVTTGPSVSDQLMKQREDMRGKIALLLISSLLFIILAGFAPIWFGWGQADDVNELLDTFFTPVLTLVGTVAGFYFGEKVAEGRTGSAAVMPRTGPNTSIP